MIKKYKTEAWREGGGIAQAASMIPSANMPPPIPLFFGFFFSIFKPHITPVGNNPDTRSAYAENIEKTRVRSLSIPRL